MRVLRFAADAVPCLRRTGRTIVYFASLVTVGGVDSHLRSEICKSETASTGLLSMRVPSLALTLVLLAVAGSVQAAETVVIDPALAEAFGGQVKPFLKKYCTHCHGGNEPKADLKLDQYADLASAAKDRDVWERVLDNVREGLMPPDPETKPDQAERDAVADWIEKQFVQIDCGVKDPGRVTIRRLNRAEYNNTIRDLCGVDFHPADDFPADDVGYGFDNIGDVLSMPPILLEKYLDAAEQIVDKAIYIHGPEKTPLHRFDAADGEHEGGNKRGSGWAFPSSGQVYVDFKFRRSRLVCPARQGVGSASRRRTGADGVPPQRQADPRGRRDRRSTATRRPTKRKFASAPAKSGSAWRSSMTITTRTRPTPNSEIGTCSSIRWKSRARSTARRRRFPSRTSGSSSPN